MKKISLWILTLVFTASLVQAQETATQQQLDKLSGQIQDLLEAQAQQGRRIETLDKEIAELREKVNTPAANDYASRDEFKKLAEQLQDVDQKRKDDTEMIAKKIEDLAKTAALTPTPTHHSDTPKVTDPTATPQNGYDYEVKPGDTLGLIVKAYRDKGVKVTKNQVIAANPKMNPNVLIPGKKIFIPDPSAK